MTQKQLKAAMKTRDQLDMEKSNMMKLGASFDAWQEAVKLSPQHADVDVAEKTFIEVNDALFDSLQREADAERDSARHHVDDKARDSRSATARRTDLAQTV
ncbi:MAG: hypothetical protein ACKPKO_15695, partial [Candidatus Fonsibacter sp.]